MQYETTSQSSFTKIRNLISNCCWRKLTILSLKLAALLTAGFALSGCLLTSPYWSQDMNDHTKAVPMQAWTTNKNVQVTFECSKASHGGLYPYSSGNWMLVANVNPQQSASWDPLSAGIYSAGKKQVLPASCWRQDPANNVWYTAIRARQGTNEYKVFTESGLECLGEENGKATSWFGWLVPGCDLKYSGSSTSIPYTIIYANS